MDENGDLLTDRYIILNSWKNCSQLLNVHMVSVLRQILVEMQTAESLVPDPTLSRLKLLLQN
jgi:hypothetical protein